MSKVKSTSTTLSTSHRADKRMGSPMAEPMTLVDLAEGHSQQPCRETCAGAIQFISHWLHTGAHAKQIPAATETLPSTSGGAPSHLLLIQFLFSPPDIISKTQQAARKNHPPNPSNSTFRVPSTPPSKPPKQTRPPAQFEVSNASSRQKEKSLTRPARTTAPTQRPLP